MDGCGVHESMKWDEHARAVSLELPVLFMIYGRVIGLYYREHSNKMSLLGFVRLLVFCQLRHRIFWIRGCYDHVLYT